MSLGLCVAMGLTGCHHRRPQPLVLPPQTPVALVEVPDTTDSKVIEAQAPKLPAVPIAQSAGKPKKTRKRPVKPAQPVTAGQAPAAGAGVAAKKPADPAPATPSAAGTSVASIGALSVGGEQSPRALQDAGDLISMNERRLAGLSADTMRTAADLVGKVRNFQKDAQQALASGDAEGAKTLATKGKLLLDDLDKANAK